MGSKNNNPHTTKKAAARRNLFLYPFPSWTVYCVQKLSMTDYYTADWTLLFRPAETEKDDWFARLTTPTLTYLPYLFGYM